MNGGIMYPICPINCSGGCPVCAPDEHPGEHVMEFLLHHGLVKRAGGMTYAELCEKVHKRADKPEHGYFEDDGWRAYNDFLVALQAVMTEEGLVK